MARPRPDLPWDEILTEASKIKYHGLKDYADIASKYGVGALAIKRRLDKLASGAKFRVYRLSPRSAETTKHELVTDGRFGTCFCCDGSGNCTINGEVTGECSPCRGTGYRQRSAPTLPKRSKERTKRNHFNLDGSGPTDGEFAK